MEPIKAVIPAAGLGTRLLPATKEMPKEMLPLYSRYKEGKILLKPLLHMIFEQIYDIGVREFCFIVGRGKRAIEDYFTPDDNFITFLYERNKGGYAHCLLEFYKKISDTTIVWINQEKPSGFGAAVYKAKPFVGNSSFVVYAGDTYIYSKNNGHLQRLVDIFLETGAAAAFLVKEVENPENYGIVEGVLKDHIIKVKRVLEKPEKPPTNLAIAAVYVFSPAIFRALEKTPLGKRGEKELTDAIQKLIDWKLNVLAVKINDNEFWLDIGTPDNYWRALQQSYIVAKTCR
ncbi:MAG: hypothetical protein DRJ51_08370 [Thermoprotei archaeon]|nr:MAG: hypothetical protein DRJ51_08370 [Thermoprotei archaeon]RLF02896.1 MAG: hypothetical protein DRJ59_02305 [Thermoprotei archaeon]